MKTFSRISAAIFSLVACTSAEAIDCGKAASALEKRICADPQLMRLDNAVGSLYLKVRADTAGASRAALLQQQRAWLEKRDRSCGSPDADCLSRVYAERRDELLALNASAIANDDKLEDVTPVVLRGRWHAIVPYVPSGSLPATGPELTRQLDFAELPRVGETVSAEPGKMCVGDQPCETFGWSKTTVGKLEGASRLNSDLGLALDRVAYVGSNGSLRSSMTLIEDKRGRMLALVILCGPNVTNCQHTLQPWEPSAPGAGFTVGSR